MAIGGIAAVEPSLFTTQSIAGRRSTLESLLGGLGSFRTALRSFGILGESGRAVPPPPQDGAGTVGVVAAAQLLLPAPAAASAAVSDPIAPPPSSSAASSSPSPSAYTAAGTPVFRAAPAFSLDIRV